MKKIIALALSVLMIFTCFVGCASESAEGSKNDYLAKAKEQIESQYKPAKKGELREFKDSEDLPANAIYDEYTYPIDWTVTVTEGAADSIKIAKSDKEGFVLLEVPLPEKDILFTLTATINGDDGAKETVSFDCKVPGTGMGSDNNDNKLSFEEILTQAYALEKGQKMEGTHSLTGKITKIDTPYDANHKNITVTITVDGFEDKPMQCYRLEGEGADTLAVGDYITVTGTITNYEGKIQFDAKCTVSDIVKGEGEAPSAETVTDVAKIMKDAKALAHEAKLPYTSVLTGKVVAVDTAYDAQYKNITVTIEVSGYADTPVKCYRLTGTGVDKIEKNDTITVSGIIKKYNQIIEFDSGCTLTKRISGGGVTKENDPAKIMEAAYALKSGSNLGYEVTLEGKVKYVKTAYDPGYKNITVMMTVAGKDLLCYRLVGNGVEELIGGDTITVTGMIKNYNGTIEFDQGCTMRKRTWGGKTVPTNKKQIVDEIFALGKEEYLPYIATLTGKITEIATAYDPGYKNLTVIIEVEGTSGMKELKCYRMKGTGAENLKVGDTITVTGSVKHHVHSSGNSELEFDAGCTFTK